MSKRIILKVRESNTGQKIVTIPKNCDIQKDEYVEIVRMK